MIFPCEVEYKGSVFLDSEKTLLDSILKNKDHPYLCKDGLCGMCRCKLIEGDVVKIKEYFYPVNDDEILPCCLKAKSKIKLI